MRKANHGTGLKRTAPLCTVMGGARMGGGGAGWGPEGSARIVRRWSSSAGAGLDEV